MLTLYVHIILREAIIDAIGPFDEALQPKLLTQFQGLKVHLVQQLMLACDERTLQSWYDKQARQRQAPTAPTQHRVFGADLDVLLPPSAADPHAAVMAVCAPTPASALPPPPPSDHARPTDGASHSQGAGAGGGQEDWVARGVPVQGLPEPVAAAVDLDEEDGKAPSTDVRVVGGHGGILCGCCMCSGM